MYAISQIHSEKIGFQVSDKEEEEDEEEEDWFSSLQKVTDVVFSLEHKAYFAGELSPMLMCTLQFQMLFVLVGG
ncbi:hypothetical protein MANES_14G020150v8 [Manihot esculenta]|uniref:Uncharacterized protein n=3 Tax=Manihot esculenta TaxID=3983 RepID=A0ACB7GES0_MANES|nr:hypothetical protein MANES_14G020150v8 [Manihot esculenta]KAG8638365.1 hypothetical protein MANES_14G020150v8 [Manihot esculenta]KAG8638366.1 hypothetical protein MANES_14G020150v8 [Manihot esculenta]